jgi:hypothetical protein
VTGIKEEAIRVVRSWANSLPEGAVVVSENESPHEYAIHVRPTKARAATVEFRLSTYGTFGLYLSTIRIEDEPYSAKRLSEILDAVEKGRVDDEVWERRGKVQRRRTILRLHRVIDTGARI